MEESIIKNNRIKNNPTVLDLFCGCGGLSLGFKNAGYNILLGANLDEVALKTFKHNCEDVNILNVDLSKKEAVQSLLGYIDDTVNVIIAGPPCQGFSLTGKRNLKDYRNVLYLAVVKAVQIFNPEAFVIENVPGIATLYKGKIKEQIKNSFQDLGYNVAVSDKPLLAADYGVPQMRKRVFFVGLKKNTFSFPKPIHTPENYITCGEAISDLPSRENELGNERDNYITPPQSNYQKNMRKNSNILFNHVATKHTKMVKETIAQVPEGGNHKDLPPGVGESRKFNEAWTRYHRNKPSRTIDTGHRNHFHYVYNRVPTVRENARLQSFPDDFVFLGSRTQQYKQVGNAVPPLLAFNIACKLKKYLTKDLTSGEHNEP